MEFSGSFWIFLAGFLAVAGALDAGERYCLAMKPDSSNRKLEKQISKLFHYAVENAHRPQRELNLPTIEPLKVGNVPALKVYSKAGRPGNAVLNDVVIEGNGATTTTDIKVTGTGEKRSIEYLVHYKYLVLSGNIKNVDGFLKNTREPLDLETKDVVFKATGDFSVNHAFIHYTLHDSGKLETFKHSSLHPASLKSVFIKVTSTSSAQLNVNILDSVIRRDCDSGEFASFEEVDDDISMEDLLKTGETDEEDMKISMEDNREEETEKEVEEETEKEQTPKQNYSWVK